MVNNFLDIFRCQFLELFYGYSDDIWYKLDRILLIFNIYGKIEKIDFLYIVGQSLRLGGYFVKKKKIVFCKIKYGYII